MLFATADFPWRTCTDGKVQNRRHSAWGADVCKIPRFQGFAWEFRFYLTAPDGKRKLKVETFDSLKYPTERDVRKAVEGQLSALNAGTLGGKLAATLGTIIERYMAEDFLTLLHLLRHMLLLGVEAVLFA
jgi:hypothetical protein